MPVHELSFGRLSCSFRPRGNLVPLPKLAGAEEEAAGKSGGDPSPPESAESKVVSDGASRQWSAVGLSALVGMLSWAWAWAVE